MKFKMKTYKKTTYTEYTAYKKNKSLIINNLLKKKCIHFVCSCLHFLLFKTAYKCIQTASVKLFNYQQFIKNVRSVCSVCTKNVCFYVGKNH